MRQNLVENIGITAARAIPAQFGFAYGWRMSAVMRGQFKWDNKQARGSVRTVSTYASRLLDLMRANASLS
jgi:hypothetical protein